MTEDIVAEVKKRRGGWPKGKPRPPKMEDVIAAADRAEARAAEPKPLIAKMKARPNWESEDFAGVGMDEIDRLKIPDTIKLALHRDGIALQWNTKSVRGMEMPQEMSKMTRGGWTPVHQDDFDGVLDGLFMPKGQYNGPIIVDDCILCARPVEIQAKSKMAERRDATRPVQVTEAQVGRGIPNVSGSGHPTATRGNMINKSVERIEIPTE